MNIRSIQRPSCGMEQAIFKCEEAMTRGEIRGDYI